MERDEIRDRIRSKIEELAGTRHAEASELSLAITLREGLRAAFLTHHGPDQQALSAESRVKLVSLTTDPDFDTPPILKTYGEKFGADMNRWMFLTGPKTNIAKLAIDSLKLTALEKAAAERESPNDLFVHSTIFVLVDQRGRLRGVFETTGDGIYDDLWRRHVLEQLTEADGQ